MSFNAWIVGYGLATILGSLFGLLAFGYGIWALVIAIDAMLLFRFLKRRKASVML